MYGIFITEVLFSGVMVQSVLPIVYLACHLFCIPLRHFYEGFCLQKTFLAKRKKSVIHNFSMLPKLEDSCPPSLISNGGTPNQWLSGRVHLEAVRLWIGIHI